MESKFCLSSLTPAFSLKNLSFSDALTSGLSAIYAKIIIVLGIALPVTEALSHRLSREIYQIYYMFLYLAGIGFIGFVYVSHIRRRVYGIGPQGYVEHFGSFYLRVGAVAFGIGTMVYSGLELGQYFETESKNCDRSISVCCSTVTPYSLCRT